MKYENRDSTRTDKSGNTDNVQSVHSSADSILTVWHIVYSGTENHPNSQNQSQKFPNVNLSCFMSLNKLSVACKIQIAMVLLLAFQNC